MKSLRAFLASCTLSVLFLPMITFAQQPVLPGIDLFDSGNFEVDSFFDVFVDVPLEEDPCDPCETIEKDIAEKEAKIAAIKLDIAQVDTSLVDLDGAIRIWEGDLEEAQAELAELRDPQNFVESEGRRYDSSDHAAMQRRSSNLWDAYKAGDLTAQEYSDEIGKDFDDPDVAKELDKLKKKIERELEDAIKALKDQIESAKRDREELNAKAAALTAELEDCLNKLEALLAALEECEKQCRQGDVDVSGLLITPEPYGFFDWLGDLFGSSDPVFPGVDTVVERLDPPSLGDTAEVPIELVSLDLVSVDPIIVTVDLPEPEPKCQMCDPLLKEMQRKKAEIEKLNQQLANAQQAVDAYGQAEEMAKSFLEQLKGNLDRLQNPPDSVESDGRTYDSTDHAAMQVRNQRLWNRYKNGSLSASELEAEWEKPFDDPDVARELEKIKEQMEDELEDDIEDVEDILEGHQENKKKFEQEVVNIKKKLAECQARLAAMEAEYQNCLKRCKEIADAVGFIEDLLEDSPPWEPPRDGFVVPTPEDEPEDQVSSCMTTGECEQTCVPQGKACVKVEKDGKTCVECSDDNECEPPAVNNKKCVERCSSGSCSRDFKAGPACFRCDDGCLEPTQTSLACEESCVLEGGACIKNPEGGKNCYDCSMDNPCDSPAMNYKECTAKCFGCSRNYEAGVACFNCDTPRPQSSASSSEDPVGFIEDLLEEEDDKPFICGVPFFGDIFCGDDDEEEEEEEEEISELDPKECPDDQFVDLAACSKDCSPARDRCLEDEDTGCLYCLPEDQCPPELHSSRDACTQDCGKNGLCTGIRVTGTLECFECEQCPEPLLLSEEECNAQCDDRCDKRRWGSLPLECWECPEKFEPQPPEPLECDDGTSEKSVCAKSCDGECVESYTREDGVSCFVCVQPPEPEDNDEEKPEVCEDGTSEKTSCLRGCDTECIESYTRKDGVECFVCVQPPEPEEEEECDTGTLESSVCARSCDGECVRAYTRKDGVSCDTCVQPPEPEECDSPTTTESKCRASCDGTCSKAYTRGDGVKCFECIEEQPPEPVECEDGTQEKSNCERSCDGECLESYKRLDGVACFHCIEEQPPEPDACPTGKTEDKASCEKQCPSDGVCVEDDGCFGCVIVNCPSGTTRNACPDSCTNGCNVVGEQHGVKCYQCKQDCATVCADNGYGPESTDHSAAILSELNSYSCVSGANISVQTATIGDCRCIGDYSLSVDTTPPVCKGTPCGDVECGGSASCPGGPNETITVNCNWGGWEQLDKHLFRPVVGN